jgi:predicted alpha/beta-fold hydrolase
MDSQANGGTSFAPTIAAAVFEPAWWCRGPHLQTLWPVLVRRRPRVALRRERLELPDGDFLDLDWTTGDSGPIVLVLHGLEGSSRSHYARGLLHAAHGRGWRGVVMHYRGCSGEPNRLPRSYHSGDTADAAYCLRVLREREPRTPVAIVGYSLGGNVLLKWLGETGGIPGVAAAVAVSVPFQLDCCARRLERGFSRLYQRDLVRRLHRKIRRKRALGMLPLRVDDLPRWRTFFEFDQHVTAPLHGFRDADHYYQMASSRQYLGGIRTPTLIIQASDDPFMTRDALPVSHELPAAVRLELYREGGHVGFVSGKWPWAASYWLEQRIPAFLATHFPS